MLDIQETDTVRQVIQLAVAAGRKRQSAETGFVHHCVHNDAACRETVPIFENMLFALALMRTRVGDQIREGRELLSRLLHFQLPDGRFPTYLHQFPESPDHSFTAHLLLPFHYIMTEFGPVLGDELLLRADRAHKSALLYCRDMPHASPLARLLTSAAFEDRQTVIETVYRSEELWFRPNTLATMMCAVERVMPLSESGPFYDHIRSMWNSELGCWAGPHCHLFYDGDEPAITLFDLMMAQKSNNFLPRLCKDSPMHLQCALLFGDACQETLQTGNVESYALEKPELSLWKGHAYFSSLWQESGVLKSLLLQGGNIAAIQQLDDGFLMTLGAPIDSEERDRLREISLFAARGAAVQVEGVRASVFSLGETVDIIYRAKTFRLRFDLHAGSGDFAGHVAIGNRPGQKVSTKAHDLLIFLRTVRRSDSCTIKVSLLSS